MDWRSLRRLGEVVNGFARGRRGAIAVTFALSIVAIMMAVGSGIDLARAYIARQQLSGVATLACQYANRPTIVALAFGSGGSAAYILNVNTFITAAVAGQHASWSQTTATPFTFTAGAFPATSSGAGNVALTASVPTSIMNMIGISSVPVSTSLLCFNALTGVPQPVADAATTLLVNESFENSMNQHTAFYLPNGTSSGYETGTAIPKVNAVPTTAGYVGPYGNEWLIMGYCLEIDTAGQTVNTAATGTHSAELDCDNGSHTAGNSSISTKFYLHTGPYELRWDYAGRIPNTYYQTSYVCGTTAGDTSWANDTSYTANSTTYGARTNQINVYLDQNTTGSPPVHTTLDGTQQLAGSNLIDECVYSYPPPAGSTTYPNGWIERSVPITVTTAGFYWLSLAADGASDSFGGQIDNVRLCPNTCAGSVADNFPASWLPAGGPNTVLFEDTFEAPTYYNGADSKGKTYNGNGNYSNPNGNLGRSVGSSSVWGEAGQGWANAPTNQLPYWTYNCPQAIQCVQLGWNTNSLISRPFLLVPGYYQISYIFASEVTFTTATDSYYCGATPVNAGLPTANSSAGTQRANGVVYASPSAIQHDTNAVGAFMSHAQVASTPNPSTTLGSAATYTNTTLNADGSIALNADGTPQTTTTTTPTVPPNAISLSNYTVSTTSPLLDICGYANSGQIRQQSVLILKPAFYWLTLAALGTVDAFGGQIDDVKVIALGSPYTAGAASSSYSTTGTGPVTIPVPGPQRGTTISYTGFSITAESTY